MWLAVKKESQEKQKGWSSLVEKPRGKSMYDSSVGLLISGKSNVTLDT